MDFIYFGMNALISLKGRVSNPKDQTSSSLNPSHVENLTQHQNVRNKVASLGSGIPSECGTEFFREGVNAKKAPKMENGETKSIPESLSSSDLSRTGSSEEGGLSPSSQASTIKPDDKDSSDTGTLRSLSPRNNDLDGIAFSLPRFHLQPSMDDNNSNKPPISSGSLLSLESDNGGSSPAIGAITEDQASSELDGKNSPHSNSSLDSILTRNKDSKGSTSAEPEIAQKPQDESSLGIASLHSADVGNGGQNLKPKSQAGSNVPEGFEKVFGSIKPGSGIHLQWTVVV